jgi:hypothetical protein
MPFKFKWNGNNFSSFSFGFTDENGGGFTGIYGDWRTLFGNPKSYALHSARNFKYCCLAGNNHRFEPCLPVEKRQLNEGRNTFGCGLLLDPKDKLAIFFTLNGLLLGEFELGIG